MLFASKIACSGIVFLLLTPWTSGPRPTPVDSGTNLSSEVVADGPRDLKDPAEMPETDVKEMQQTLQDEGHYRGKIDGVFGLRTRASIRAYQKAENLPVTGQLNVRTARKLGVRPEARQETGYGTTMNKPSAGIEWTNGSRRTRKMPRNTNKSVAASESGRGDSGKTLQAED